MRRFIARCATAALAFGGIGIAGISPAAAGSCTASPVQTWQAYNVNCSYVQHWDRLSGGVYKYAPQVSPQMWSSQGACWAGVVSYGANKGVLVNYV